MVEDQERALLILQPAVTSPTSQLILQPFFCLSYVTGSSLTSPGELPTHHYFQMLILLTPSVMCRVTVTLYHEPVLYTVLVAKVSLGMSMYCTICIKCFEDPRGNEEDKKVCINIV